MNIILGLGIGVIGVLVLMGYITLERKLNNLDKKMDKQKVYWKSVEKSIEIQSNQVAKESAKIMFTPLKVKCDCK